ncbi:MAG: VCBS repeat-containing protein [bacterium]|nr:VCBS repeat-containing protein [bacterium]
MNTFDIAMGDIDNDGDPDVVSTNGHFRSDESYPTLIFLNDGTGSFTDSGQILTPVKTGRAGVGDLNNDGYIDILLTGYQMPVHVWLNDGQGKFQDSGIRLGTNEDIFTSCQIIDLDNDGDNDIFASATFGGKNRIWFNNIRN